MDDTLVLKLEFIIIYFILPIVLVIANIKYLFFLILILVSIYAFFTLKKDKEFNLKSLLHKIYWKQVLILNIIFAVNIYLYTFIFYPELLFSLPKKNLALLIMIIIFYPVVSVAPQELIYRVFFCQRYKKILGHNYGNIILINTFVFAFGHIIFLNLTALIFTAIASPIFLIVYLRYSFATCLFLHALSGLLVFIFGLGKFFF